MSRSLNNGPVLIMAGGTGGHIFPGLAVASALQKRGIAVRWLGASGGMECDRVPKAGIELDTVEISGLRGKGVMRWVLAPFRLLKAVYQASSVLGKTRPSCVLSFGGYAAGPGGVAAWLKGIPLLVHEQNRIPGLTNRVLSKLAKKVLQAFPGTFEAGKKVATVGNPVRDEVLALPAPEQRLADRSGPLRLLITGGSQGALTLNRLLPKALADLPNHADLEIRHQAGKNRSEATQEGYQEAGVNARVDDFIEDMAGALAWADLVVCRSGALTVSELAATGVAAVLVPFPYAVDDHQTRNGEVLSDVGAAKLLPETTLTASTLSRELAELLSNRPELLRMAQLARSQGIRDAAERVADHAQHWGAQ